MAKPTIGWIGVGRMGYQMVERLIKDGQDVSIWNLVLRPIVNAGP